VLDAAAVRRVWDEILTHLGNKRRAAAAVAREATVREVDGNTLVLLFKHAVHANMLSNGPELLIEAVYEVLGAPSPGASWRVRCEVSGPDPGSAKPAPVPPGPRPPEPQDDASWPTTAQLGGPTAAPAPCTEPQPPPPVPPAASDGFDPGDEPLDEVIDEQTARQTSEQQALHTLAQALGAEKIGELDSR
jgi:DNA polymerase-3 subunit gamma/tau